MPRGDWMKNLTPEQRAARTAKMRAAKAARAQQPKDGWVDDKTYIEHEPVAAPQPLVMATPSELRYLKDFRALLNEYLNALSGLNALGMPSVIDYCRMCAGNGIHLLGCGCLCHKTRKLLQEYANEFGPQIEGI